MAFDVSYWESGFSWKHYFLLIIWFLHSLGLWPWQCGVTIKRNLILINLVIKPGKKQSVSERNSGKVLFLIWRVFFHVPAKAEKSFFEEVKKSEGGKSCLTLGCYCRVVYCRLFWGGGGLYFCLELCVNVIWKQQKKKKKRKQENKKYAILL